MPAATPPRPVAGITAAPPARARQMAPTSPVLAPGPGSLPPLPPSAPVEAPPASASALLGARPEQLLGRFGPPALRREEAGAQIWLYLTPACQLDLVLYPEAGTMRVAHAQARASGLAQRTEAACLREIAARRRQAAPALPLPAPAA